MIIAIHEHLDEHAFDTIAIVVVSSVRCLAHVIPKVKAHAVSHPDAVYGHSVEYPTVLLSDAKDTDIEFIASLIDQFHCEGFLFKFSSRCPTVSQFAVVAHRVCRRVNAPLVVGNLHLSLYEREAIHQGSIHQQIDQWQRVLVQAPLHSLIHTLLCRQLTAKQDSKKCQRNKFTHTIHYKITFLFYLL